MTAQPGESGRPTEPGYHGLVLCDECNGQQSMPECKCQGVGWLLHGKPTTEEAKNKAFGAMYSSRMDRKRTEIPARFAVIDAAHHKVAAALGNDDPRVTELIGMVRLLLPSPASEWQDERPDFGDWWVSIHPSKRRHQNVIPVRLARSGFVIMGFGQGRKCGIDSGLFVGAKWMRRDAPADPFLPGVRDGK